MIQRKKTITVKVGSVNLGSEAPVALQSMTKVATTDIDLCVKQANQLIQAGCDFVRIAIPTKKDAVAFAKIVPEVKAPVIADIHFSRQRAIDAIEAGAAKIRLNPGNIKDPADVDAVIDAAASAAVAIRIGVNEASIRDLKSADVPPEKRCDWMLEKMREYVRIFEKKNFDQLVLSAKSADPLRTIEINRLLAENFQYPLHLGLTHAGLPEDAAIPSAASLGTLLAEGIGDTIRVSAAGDPVVETQIAKQILISLGLRDRQEPELIVCPTCGRAQIDVTELAREVKKLLKDIHQPLRVAVMGCIVNGPGEAADADLALCAGKAKATLFKNGKKLSTIPEDRILPALKEQLAKMTQSSNRYQPE